MGARSREYIYGLNPAFEVVRAGRRRIWQAFLSTSAERNPRMKKLETFLTRSGVPVEWVEKGRVMDLAESRENQGVVLKCSPYPYAAMDEVLGAERILLLNHVEDPHNVGAILRSAEIFGFNHVLLPLKGTPDIYPSIVKVSAGATEFMRICKESNPTLYVRRLKDEGYELLALDGSGDVDVSSIADRLGKRIALVIGGEDCGVGQYVLNESDYIVRIAQSGQINSLNASVAAGIAMHALRPGPGNTATKQETGKATLS